VKENVRYLSTIILMILVGCDQPGRYQIAASKASTPEDDRAWVLDTKTGRVALCYEHAAAVKCLHASAIPPQKDE
jgi:hypothetical protein